jgi:hypothetical protein
MWRTSPWDGLVHGFRPENIGNVTAEAICTHSTLTTHLTTDNGQLCQACALLHGDELAGRHGDPHRYSI